MFVRVIATVNLYDYLYCAKKDGRYRNVAENSIGLELERNGFAQGIIFSEGFSKPKRDVHVIRGGPNEFL